MKNKTRFFFLKTQLLWVLLCSISSIQAQTNFIPHDVSYASNPWDFTEGMVIQDFDGDGLKEVVVIVSSNSENRILGVNESTSTPNTPYVIASTDDKLVSICESDLNNDGHPDIIVGTKNANGILFYENNGNGVFSVDTIDNNITSPEVVNAWDMDGDGDIDIISYQDNTPTSEGKIVWYENNGSQIFETHLIDSIVDFESIYPEDIDGDGDMDFTASRTSSGTAYWYENDGSQNFTLHSTSSSGMIVPMDLDQDGDVDFISSESNGSITWHENDGNEVFTTNYANFSSFIDSYNSIPYINDVNGDGYLDIVIATADSLIWLENDGSQNFTMETITATYGNNLVGIPSDKDNDGDIDIIAFNLDWEIYWYENNGIEQFTQNLLFDLHMTSYSTFSVDMDSDGDLDIVSNDHYKNLSWHENLNDHTFNHHAVLAQAYSVSPVDFDADGDMDFLAISSRSDSVVWLENDGDQNFEEHTIVNIQNWAWYINENRGVYPVDVDSDGDIDITSTFLGLPFSMNWLENDGNQNFTNQILYNPPGAANYYNLYDIDLDSDGDIDFITFDVYGVMSWLENDGNQNFTTNSINSDAGILRYVMSVDIDQDGDHDILYSNRTSFTPVSEVNWLENDGNQNFTKHNILSNISCFKLLAEDLDQDGDLDIVTLGHDENYLNWLDNDGSQNFSLTNIKTLEILGSIHQSLSTGDIDQDGDLDIIAGNPGSNIEWYENTVINSLLNLKIKAFHDANENSIPDPLEPSFYAGNVSVSPIEYYQTISNDAIELFLSTGEQYSITLNIDTSIWEPVDSLNRSIYVDSAAFIDSVIYIPLIPKNDLLIEADIVGSWPRCQDTIVHYISYQNLGSALDTGYVTYLLAPEATFVSSVPTPSNITGQLLTYEFNNVNTSDQREIILELKMPTNIDTLEYTLEVFVDTGSFELAINTSFEDIVKCSYDPNDKQVFPNYGGQGYIHNDTPLEYQIRFQNMGNDTAYTVKITDTLDQNLDMNSFQLLHASHQVSCELDYLNRTIEFIFEEINLPDTLTNHLASFGFVKYKIMPNETLTVGDSILNTASIYFDYNDPIVTNTTINKIYDCDWLGDHILLSDSIYELPDDDLSISINEDFISGVNWIQDGSIVSEHLNIFSPYFNTIGTQEINIQLENELCTFDTLITIHVISNVTIKEDHIELMVYPNPSRGLVQIDFNKVLNNITITQSNVLGQVVNSKQFQSINHINYALLGENGIYFLDIYEGQNLLKHIKIIKQ